MPEELDYAPRIVLPTEGELSPSEINQLISTATTLRKIDMESKAAARRYRGQQQLQTLIQQGVPMEKAMMQVSGDLFYQQPEHFTPMLRQFEMDRRNLERLGMEKERLDIMREHYRNLALKPPSMTPEQKAVATAKTKKAAQDFSVWNQKYRAAVAVKQAVQKARDEFLAKNPEADPKKVNKGLAVHGENLMRADRELDAILKEKPSAEPIVGETEEPQVPTADLSGTWEQSQREAMQAAGMLKPPPQTSTTNTVPRPLPMPAGPAPRTGRVRVKSPAGKVGHVPAEQVDQALKEGYTLLE